MRGQVEVVLDGVDDRATAGVHTAESWREVRGRMSESRHHEPSRELDAQSQLAGWRLRVGSGVGDAAVVPDPLKSLLEVGNIRRELLCEHSSVAIRLALFGRWRRPIGRSSGGLGRRRVGEGRRVTGWHVTDHGRDDWQGHEGAREGGERLAQWPKGEVAPQSLARELCSRGIRTQASQGTVGRRLGFKATWSMV